MRNLASRFVAILAVAGIASCCLIQTLPTEVQFESLESKTDENEPVFNKIRFIPGKNRDVWMMNQKHANLDSLADRLAIVVNKSDSTVRFYQLLPGELEWKEPVKEIGFRVSCFMCHSNGPRAIRPNFASKTFPVSLEEKASIFAWNVRIKTYGRLKPADHGDEQRRVKFQKPGHLANEKLHVKTCLHCHSETGLFARGSLTKQNFVTIRFLVQSGQMPPPGFSLSDQERGEIEKFIGSSL